MFNTSMTPTSDMVNRKIQNYYRFTKPASSSLPGTETIAKYLTVVRELSGPAGESDISNGTYQETKTITLEFDDRALGSGFSHRFAVVSDLTALPSNWGRWELITYTV